MVKGFRMALLCAALALAGSAVFAQGGAKSDDVTYDKRSVPIQIVKRLSYENYRDIKLLYTAIVNYGGGEAEFDKLVEEYAEASALFFSNKIVESANMFTRNERNIAAAAYKLAAQYKADVSKLHDDVVRMKVKAGIKMSLKGAAMHGALDKVVADASHAFQRANDLEVRKRPIDAIFYYRMAKRNYFQGYDIVNGQFVELATKTSNKNDKDYLLKLAESYKIPEKYKKDAVDNGNRVYESREKQK